MRKKRLHTMNLLALLLGPTLLFFLGTPARAQSAPAQDNKSTQDNDTTRKELAQFDQFMDGHREIAEQLRKDPSLVNSKEFAEKHPALQTYLRGHPGIREEIKENPDAFMRKEDRFDRHEDARDNDTTRKELAQFDQFMDGHREIAEQLRKDPSLVNKKEFVENHPALQTYLQEHPGIREEVKENPNAFLRQEDRFDRHEDARDSDATRKELAQFDRFADSHREIGEQLRKDPSLVNNKEFVENHPALQAFLQEQPGIRDEVKENPNAFIRQEDRFDRHEDTHDSDATRGHLASFGEFLGGHSTVAQQVSKNPSLVTDKEYLKSHPELHEYLNAHPDVRDEMAQNPQSFVKSAQQFNNNNNGGGFKAPAPTADPKPKQ